MPPPGPPPQPPPFPAPSAPGVPPSALPELPLTFSEPITDLGPDAVDPALGNGFAGLVDRPTRLRAASSPEWSTATIVRADGPMRHSTRQPVAFFDERPLALTVARIPAASLPDAPPGIDVLSRLRMVHRRLIPGYVQRPVDATWQQLGGQPAVLDRLCQPAGGRICGFSLASAVDDGGLVATGWSPPDRTETLQRVAIPLASLARPDGSGLAWASLPLWSTREELQISTSSVLAVASLEPLRPGQTLTEWTEVVYRRAPFLRGMQRLGDRPVTVRGVDEAWLSRFDWQPAGRGRSLTTVVTGVSGGEGFSFSVEVPFEGEHLLLDPDAILAMIEVLPPSVPRALPPPPQMRLPAAPPVPPPAPPPPPVPRSVPVPPVPVWPVGPRDRYLDAAVDRLVVAAIDIADGPPSDVDRYAVGAALDAILGRSGGPPLPWHGRPDVLPLVLARLHRWRDGAELIARVTPFGRTTVPLDEVWAVASIVASEAAAARTTPTGGLAAVLQQVRQFLEEPDAAWDDALFTVQAGRPPRYRFRAFLDPGSGHLLWSGNPDTQARWDYPVDHFDLPVPLNLARWIQHLLDSHDARNPDLARDRQPFAPAEWQAFAAGYAACIAELRRTLGPAYVVDDESRITG
jgi:hypothetical protein